MVEPHCLILDRLLPSAGNMENDSASALAPMCYGFPEQPAGPQPQSESQAQPGTWKLWSRQFLIQKMPKSKGKDLAAVSKEQFMLFLLASTFAAPHEIYLENMNCLLSAGNFPKLTSLQHDWLNVPQMVKKGGPRRKTVAIERCSPSLKQSVSNFSILNNLYF